MGRDDVRTIDVHRGASSCCADSTPRFSAVLGASRTHDRVVSRVFWEEAATRSPQRQDGPLGRYLSTPADEPWSPVLKAVKRDFSRGQSDHRVGRSTSKSQFVIATHSPVLLTFPDADIVSFDVAPLRSVRLQDTSHYQITRGILEDPQSYWRHLLKKDDD